MKYYKTKGNHPFVIYFCEYYKLLPMKSKSSRKLKVQNLKTHKVNLINRSQLEEISEIDLILMGIIK